MKTLPLSQGMIATVDDDDYERCAAYKWSMLETGPGRRYAIRHDYSFSPYKMIYLHRFILDAPEDMQVDHINHNTLDCRKANIRLCTQSQNMANVRPRPGKYKGVRRSRFGGGGFVATLLGKYLGRFDTAEQAAHAYDTAARRKYGAFACINFPDKYYTKEEVQEMKSRRHYKPETKVVWVRLPMNVVAWINAQRNGDAPTSCAVIRKVLEEAMAQPTRAGEPNVHDVGRDSDPIGEPARPWNE